LATLDPLTTLTLTPLERWLRCATPQAIEDAVEHRLRRWQSLRYPGGTMRRMDRTPRPDKAAARCACLVPLMVTTSTRAVVCQTCRRPLRSRRR
jgi:hypothetical protein